MPFALLTIGLILVITGARNTYQDMGRALVGDFTGKGNFTYWLLAFGVIGSLGYVEQLRVFSRAFMALVLLSMILKNGGVFAKATQALQQGPQAPVAKPSEYSASPTGTGSSGGSSGINTSDIAKTAATLAPLLL
jgi:hypothetical protein